MEDVQKQTTNTEMDPRTKDTHGLDAWAAALHQNGLIGAKEYEDFVQKNNSKEKMLEERGLPQLKHYGHFDSVEEIRDRIKPKDNDRFIIRCSSKEGGEIKRLLDADLEEICDFAKKLPGGFEKWDVEVKEFVETFAAGTIIVAPNGRTNIEMWHGPHYLNTTNVQKYHGDFDPEQFHMRYHWDAPAGADDLSEMQQHALKAIRYFFRYLKPKENESIYIEYGVKKGGEIYFIEANDSSLLTGK